MGKFLKNLLQRLIHEATSSLLASRGAASHEPRFKKAPEQSSFPPSLSVCTSSFVYPLLRMKTMFLSLSEFSGCFSRTSRKPGPVPMSNTPFPIISHRTWTLISCEVPRYPGLCNTTFLTEIQITFGIRSSIFTTTTATF